MPFNCRLTTQYYPKHDEHMIGVREVYYKDSNTNDIEATVENGGVVRWTKDFVSMCAEGKNKEDLEFYWKSFQQAFEKPIIKLPDSDE